MNIDFEPNPKQYELLQAFDELGIDETLYGGAASGGKTYGLCALHIIKSIQYPKIRSLIGRNELKNLKKTTLKTFFKVCSDWSLKAKTHYNYHQKDGVITFFNGSEIILQDLKYLPSDPDCTWLGSLELTFASIDEAGEVHQRVKEVLHSRCGRWLNRELKIKPMLFQFSNPSRNYLFAQYYKPFKDGVLPANRKFIQALITDHGLDQDGEKRTYSDLDPEEYALHLQRVLSFNDYQRLVLGKWEFDDDPNACTTFIKVNEAYDYAEPDLSDVYYITADIAFESDKCVIIVWNGLEIIKIIEHDKSEKPEEKIQELQSEYSVQRRNICYDATGAGMYLKNYLPGSYVFHSGAKPINGEKFEHLKTQCYKYLADAFNDNLIKVFDENLRDEFTDELLQIKTIPREKIETKVKMIKKDQIKKYIGRSPDILDAAAMRFVYEIKGKFQSCI